MSRITQNSLRLIEFYDNILNMEETCVDLKKQIGNNISEYRRLANMSQIEFAEKLNYSDKAVSKWERGESLPDIIVLKQIADLFQITVNDLIGYSGTKKKIIDLKKIIQNKKLILFLSIGIVWLVATTIYVILQLVDVLNQHNWLVFVYALPISSIVSIIFYVKWKKYLQLAASESMLVWSLALSFCLSINYRKIWYILIVAIPLQILIILWNWFVSKKKKRV